LVSQIFNVPNVGVSLTHLDLLYLKTLSDKYSEQAQTRWVVVAAGNTLPEGQNQLAYPARFAEVIAVGALDSKCVRSPISNYGAVDHVEDPHSSVFFVPGGGAGEFVGSTANPAKNLEGTSFAAAYASGLVALYLSQPTTIDRSRHTTLGYFRTHADRFFPAYSPREHGNGLMKIA
jgi:subtilisin family serine protease